MILLFVCIIILTFYLTLKKPTYLVVFYIIASTKFLGFFDMGLFVVGGIDLGFFSINIIVLLSSLYSKYWYKINKFILPMYLTIAILIVYGIINPYINGYENLQQAIIASKSFLYFSIFFYMFGRRKEINIKPIITFLKFLGIYLSTILIISLVSSSPPFYQESYIEYSYVRIYFPTYISLALFLFYASYQKSDKKNIYFLTVFIVLLFGLILSGYFALLISTLFSLGFIYFIWHKKASLNWYKFFKKIIYLFVSIGIIFLFSEKLRTITIDTITVIVDGSDVALASRDRYNKFRWNAIEQKPLFGYGFIYKNAPIMNQFETSNNSYMEKLGVIDSGYVDLLIRFGYIGMVLYLFVFGIYLIKVFLQKQPNIYSLAISAFLFQYYFVSYTWSVFTFRHGIIPMALAFFILYHFEKRSLKSQKIIKEN